MASSTPAPDPGDEPSRMPWLAFWTFGLATPFIFIQVAHRKPTQQNKTALAVYMGSLVATVCTLGIAGILVPLVLWGVGTVHLFAIRDDVWPRGNHRRSNPLADFDPTKLFSRLSATPTPIDHVAQAKQERNAARETVADDPMLAKKLGIGRPDLNDRAVEDGGLVDLNHAPAEALMTLPGINKQVSHDIVDYRERHGSIADFGELVFAVNVNPKFESQLKEYAIFIP